MTITLSAAVFMQPSHAFAAESAKTVILGGQPFGVKFFNDGVMVIDLESFFSGGKYVCPAKEGGLEVNDVIRQVNETRIKTNEDLQRATHNCAGEPIRLTITRGEKELIKTIRPQKNTDMSFPTNTLNRASSLKSTASPPMLRLSWSLSLRESASLFCPNPS